MAHDVVKDWTTKAGLRAVILFIKGSHHCGYVALPKDHPLHGVGYGDNHPLLKRAAIMNQPIGSRGIFSVLKAGMSSEDEESTSPDVFFDVHGSITYAEGGDDYPAKGEGLWWYGYDCAHAGDQTHRYKSFDPDAVFRDADFCERECERLAEQLEAVRDFARSAV